MVNAEYLPHSPDFTYYFKAVKTEKERKSCELSAVKMCIFYLATSCMSAYKCINIIEKEENWYMTTKYNSDQSKKS